MTVDDLFRDFFGNYTHDRLGRICSKDLPPMPLESVCGAECEQVMKDGKVLFDHREGSHEGSFQIAKVVHQICSIFCHG